MNDFLRALRKGLVMSRNKGWIWLQGIGLIATIAAIIVAPFGLELIESMFWKILGWILLLVTVGGLALIWGLTPYWGQKEITRDQMLSYEKEKTENEKYMRSLEQELRNRGWDGKTGLS